MNRKKIQTSGVVLLAHRVRHCHGYSNNFQPEVAAGIPAAITKRL